MEGGQDSYLLNGLRSSRDQPHDRGTFFHHITATHGYKITKALKQWTRFRHDLARANARRQFLLDCRKFDIFPKHIESNVKHSNSLSFYSKKCKNLSLKYTTNSNKKLLKFEIKDIHIHISFLHKKLNNLRTQIEHYNINSDILQDFFKLTEIKSNDIFEKLLNNLKNKIQWRLQKTTNNQKNTNSQWVRNLTPYELPKEIIDVASLGSKFNVSSKLNKQDFLTTIKNVEICLSSTDLNTDTKNDIRNTILHNLNYENKKTRHIPIEDRIFSQKLFSTKKFLKENSDIFFTHADKGNLTVCMSRSDYNEKMNKLLSDTNTYSIVKKNPLKILQSNVHSILKKFNDKKYFTKQYHNNSLTQTHTTLAKAYGLPKIHKENNPLRPIISSINSPTHFLAKSIYSELKKCIKTPLSHINNSFELKKKLSEITIPDNYILLSLDVSSLFTNIPKELILKSLDRRFPDIHNKCNIPFHEIRSTVEFLCDNTFFMFNGTFYKQKLGTPMGSPISPIFADMVMEDLEIDCLKELKTKLDCCILFYYRYVDDTLLCVRKDKIDLVLNTFNNYNKHLQFTHEIENSNSINFLDITIEKKDNVLITNWYRKENLSNRLLNFKSNHSSQQKKNIIYNLIDRAILLSHNSYHSKNLNIIRNLLRQNEYPHQLINTCIRNRLRKIKFTDKQTTKNTVHNLPKHTLALPYNNNFYNKCSTFLKKYNIRTVPLINKKLNNVIKLGKDKTEKWDTTGIVYKFSCKNCPVSYVGQTKRSLRERINEHKKSSNSVVSTHINTFSHEFDWDNTIILDREPNYKKRIISEMIHINSTPHTINKKEDVEYLNRVYKSVNIVQ